MIEQGIVLYDIEMDGCLNGVYTNENHATAGVIFNEIARKKGSSLKESDSAKDWDIEGEYDCMWFDIGTHPDNRENAILVISRKATSPRVFDVTWLDVTTRNPRFAGTGYFMNSRQFVVRYEQSKPINT